MHFAQLRALGLLLPLTAALCAAPPEPHAEPLAASIRGLKERLERNQDLAKHQTVFLCVWDFDGTLLRGDCSEGWREEGQPGYPGLAELSIRQGLSGQYPAGEGAFERFWQDYSYLDKQVGHWLAYPFLAQMLHGAKAEDVLSLSRQHFREVLSSHLFASSLLILHQLEESGIRNYIISASPELFVKGAAESLKLSEDRISGIRLEETNTGRLTTRIRQPVTWAEGKVERLQQILSQLEQENPGCRVHILAAFGNSYSTDGPFLKFCTDQPLPGGERAVVCMINGGSTPEAYQGRFTLLEQRQVLGPQK